MSTPLRLGILGARRGQSCIEPMRALGVEVVALCDRDPTALARTLAQFPGPCGCDTLDALLADDGIDAVFLANHFHEHAPAAIRALQAGKHVLSECAACFSPAEAVALVEAAEHSGRIYMLAENYPYMLHNQEIRRLYREGAIGRAQYAECEYVHPSSAEERLGRSPGLDHWRSWLPATCYATHSVAPPCWITDGVPRWVSAFVVPYAADDPQHVGACLRRDVSSTLMIGLDNGVLVKALHLGLRGHGKWTSVHGTRGLLENARSGDQDRVQLRVEAFDAPDGQVTDRTWKPHFPEHHTEAMRAGHGGGDFFTCLEFVRAIQTGIQPWLDAPRGCAISLCGILGWRSALAGGARIEIPDLRDPAARDRLRHDTWTPGPQHGPTSVLGAISPGAAEIAHAQEVWARRVNA